MELLFKCFISVCPRRCGMGSTMGTPVAASKGGTVVSLSATGPHRPSSASITSSGYCKGTRQ